MRQNNSLKLDDVRRTLPTLDAAAACAQKLKEAMFGGITETDMADIMKNLVKKAKEGDLKATKVLFDTVVKAQPAPQPVRFIYPPSANGNGAHPALPAGDRRRVQVACAKALGKEGTLTTEEISDETEFPEEAVAESLAAATTDVGWFEAIAPDKWRLTTLGRKELLG